MLLLDCRSNKGHNQDGYHVMVSLYTPLFGWSSGSTDEMREARRVWREPFLEEYVIILFSPALAAVPR